MTDARAEILARTRTALGDAIVAPADIPRHYRRTSLPGVDIVERFAERVADYRAEVVRAIPATVPDLVAGIVAGWRAHRLVVPAGLPAEWLAAVPADVERLTDEPALDYATLDAADGTIAGCAVAIAETGTIVLDAGPGQGRRVLSLLPDRLLCVVERDRIVGDVAEALERLDPTRPLTWISGPSATSDIELERVEGVHGPRVLEVIVVD